MHLANNQMSNKPLIEDDFFKNNQGNYQDNVEDFIKLREQTHSTISLVFEMNEQN
jgi:hypothetical protein